MLLLQVSRLVYPWKLFLNVLSKAVLSSAAQAWLPGWCGSWTHWHLACSMWPWGKHCCWKHICSGGARPQRSVIKADTRWIGVVWHAAVPPADFVWSTWVWIMTLITEQYFFICSISLSSCFFPVWSCHFLLYLVKAFFLLLYLEHRKAHYSAQNGSSKSAVYWIPTSFYKICACTRHSGAPQRRFWRNAGRGWSGCTPPARPRWQAGFQWWWPPLLLLV